MPRWSRWMVRCALLYLLLGLGLSVATSVPSWVRAFAWLAAATPALFHLLVVGWATQLIFGVAYWLFPRASRPMPSGSERWAGVVFVSLNLGLSVRLLAEPMQALSAGAVWSWALLLSALLQWLSGVIFVATIWRRVKEK